MYILKAKCWVQYPSNLCGRQMAYCPNVSYCFFLKRFFLFIYRLARLAQSVEHETLNLGVVG
jgi:hypothetical protein